VLPLANLSGDPAQEYVADGITEELTTDLAQLDTIRVISRASAIHYRNTNKTTPVIGQELRVDAVVEGAVAHLGNRIRITLQLIHAATDRHIWARSFEGDSRDVAALERGIARAVAEQIEARLSRTSRTRFSRAQTTPEAYEAYLKGVYLWNRRTEPDFAKALHYFEEAVRIDPGYAEAYAGISYCYALGYLGVPVRDTISKAKDAAAKALQLDDSLAQAHAAVGLIRHNYDWDFPGAEKEYRRAIQLNPNYAPVYGFYGMELAALGRMDDALAALERAHEIDALSLIIATQMGNILYFARQYDRAIEQYRKALDLDPKFEVAHAFLARAYEARGLYVNAAQEYLTAHYATERAGSVVSSPNFDWRVFWQADLQFRLRQRAAGQRIPAFHMAEVSARLGDKGGAFRWLRLSCEERDNRLTLVNVLSTLDNIRSDPRFRDILDCANIKP
jgi:TolB-like protein/Tfp pilus assembly protein PilF